VQLVIPDLLVHKVKLDQLVQIQQCQVTPDQQDHRVKLVLLEILAQLVRRVKLALLVRRVKLALQVLIQQSLDLPVQPVKSVQLDLKAISDLQVQPVRLAQQVHKEKLDLQVQLVRLAQLDQQAQPVRLELLVTQVLQVQQARKAT
jgi:hypothetical protein